MRARSRRPPAKPLSGRRVLITRARPQAGSLRRALEGKGARVFELPTIAIATPRSWQGLDRALERLESYDWILFTSANGVESFFARLRRASQQTRRRARASLRRAQIAAIGPATAAALRRHGARARIVPREYRAEGLLKALGRQRWPRGQRGWQGKRVLLARAAEAREILPQELGRRGARVDVIEAYRTVVPRGSRARLRQLWRSRKPDAITFTSSSTVRNFCTLLGGPAAARRALRGVAVATIGPITSRTAREFGLRVALEAKRYTIPGLVKAIEEYFRGR